MTLVRVTRAGERIVDPAERPAALLPGAFDPVHAGHWGLAEVAAETLGLPVAFELSVANVDKPPLGDAEVARRLAPFRDRAEVWVTRAPRFVEKAAAFPGATFVVGADTALRLFALRYYDGDARAMLAALEAIRERGCRFLTATRRLADGSLQTAETLPIPSGFEDLFAAIPTARFRLDLSSTELRRPRG